MFWGAPLVAREFEGGTVRLAWTQGVTRTRWLAAKLGLGALASVAVTGLLTLMVTWSSNQLDYVHGDVNYNALGFGIRDIAPIGYAASALVLGASAGLLFRRTLPAMASALVGFAAVREIVTRWVRPQLYSPLHTVLSISAGSPVGFDETPTGMKVMATTRGLMPNAWVYSNQVVDTAGKAPTQAFLAPACPFNQTTGQAELLRLHRQARRQVPRIGDLSASESLLGFPVVRDGDLPRPRHHSRRDLLLVDPPPHRLSPIVTGHRRSGSSSTRSGKR